MSRHDAVPPLRRQPTPVAAVTHSSAPTSLHPPDARATISSSHHTAAVLPLHSPADDLIHTQHTYYCLRSSLSAPLCLCFVDLLLICLLSTMLLLLRIIFTPQLLLLPLTVILQSL